MSEKFEYEGKWWFPEKPDCKVHGKLDFTSEDGIQLHLRDCKSEEDSKNIKSIICRAEEEEINITILGSSLDRKEITLSGCFCKTFTNNFPTVFSVRTVFIGILFNKKEDEKFKEVSVGFQHLGQWVDVSGLKIRYQKSSKTPDIAIRYKRPNAIKFYINEDLNVEISFEATNSVNRYKSETYLKEEVTVDIKPSTDKSLVEFLEIINIIQNFLTLAVSEPVEFYKIEGKTELKKMIFGEREFYEPVHVLSKRILINTLNPPSFIIPQKMLFTLKAISRKKKMLKTWFDKAELLKPVYDLYFGTLYQPGMYTTNEFLNLIQALESYHRRIMKNRELSKIKYKKRIEAIIRKAPPRYADWLKKKLANSNEPSLPKRLEELLKKHPEATSQYINNKDAFISKTVKTRNYYTHFDKSHEHKIAKGKDLLILIVQLGILTQICLLGELGFTTEEREHLITELIKKKYSQILPH